MSLDFIIKIGLGIAGILLFSAFNAQKSIKEGTFKITIHFKENWKRWLWATFVLTMVALIIEVEPQLAEVIKKSFGLDIGDNRGAFFITGIALAGLVKGVVNKKVA